MSVWLIQMNTNYSILYGLTSHLFLGVATVMMGKSATRLVNGDDCDNCNRQGVWIKHSDASNITVSNSPFSSSKAFVLWYLSPYQDEASLARYGVQMAFGHFGIKARTVQGGNWGEWTTIL